MQAAAEPGFAELLLVIDAQKAFMTGADAVPDHRALETALSSLGRLGRRPGENGSAGGGMVIG